MTDKIDKAAARQIAALENTVKRLEQDKADMLLALEAVRNMGAIGLYLEAGEKHARVPRMDELNPEVFDQVKAAIVKAKSNKA